MSASPSQRFGPYVILDQIGDGGMAEIFLAKMHGYSGFEKLIALKTMHPRYGANEAFKRMLIEEAKLAASLNHLNVVQVHDLGEVDNQVYIAMEFVRGRDLAAVLSNTYKRNEQLPVELSLFIATEFMAGVEYAHRYRKEDGTLVGIIHRDISPQNILISFEGAVKVTDFGIARAMSDGEDTSTILHGKFGYMSPEQVRNQGVDQRSDIFSVGVVLWEMLVGARLFRGRDHTETLEMILQDSVVAPSTRNRDVTPSIDRICMKALSQRPEDRYQTMGSMLGELSRVTDKYPRRAGSRDLSVYMRRQFGSPGVGFTRDRGPRVETNFSGLHSGFQPGTMDELIPRRQIGRILVDQGSISPGQLELALAEQRAQGGRIGEVLLSHAAIDDTALAKALATQAELPNISSDDLTALPPPSELLARFPKDAAQSSCVLPLAVDPTDERVRLAVCDPYDERAVLEAKVVLGVDKVQLSVAPRSAIREAVSAWYGPRHAQPPLPIAPTLERRILIADSQREQAESLAARLMEEGCEVEIVSDGRKAREALYERPPCVAFLDAALPRIDGYNLLLETRALHPATAVYVSSGRRDELSHAKAIELGADDVVVKPFQLEVLASKVRRELQRNVQRPVPAVGGGVSGSLSDMSVIDITQSLELGRKTAHVVLQYQDGRQGCLRFDAGRVSGCEASGLQGADAFYYLVQPGEGLFRIEYRDSEISSNIVEPNTFLIIEAMRRLDEGDVPRPPVATAHAPADVGPPLDWAAMSLTDDLVLDGSHDDPTALMETEDIRSPSTPKRVAKITLRQHPQIVTDSEPE